MSQVFIARDPDDSDDLISWWQGDDHLEEKTQVTVGVDEIAVFFDEEVLCQLGPGMYMLNAEQQPALADYLTSDDPPDCEVAFIKTTAYELFFNEEASQVTDADTGTSFTAWLKCETFFMEVVDPAKFIAAVDQLAEGELDDECEGASDGAFDEFVAGIALKNATSALADREETKSIHLRAVLDGQAWIRQALVEDPANQWLAKYGVCVRIPSPVIITVGDDEREELEGMAKK